MNSLTLTESQEKVARKEGISFNWSNSPAIQRILDVISSILAEEYITIAKQNPIVFSGIASPPRGFAMTNFNGGEK